MEVVEEVVARDWAAVDLVAVADEEVEVMVAEAGVAMGADLAVVSMTCIGS